MASNYAWLVHQSNCISMVLQANFKRLERRRRAYLSTGDANDYVGKGTAGGKVVIKPHQGTAFTCNEANPL
ncbi:hypothetical protein OK016_11965 [Vibrio chagasii]|nr:hypothetical protein [Vibrio chagasii]